MDRSTNPVNSVDFPIDEANAVDSPYVYRWAMTVTLFTFPLIWLGGLVTTHHAGMAVPDWPGTFGYNLFLYPWSAWLYGPFDLFVEHGHRLLASLVGLLAIGLCIVAYRHEQRIWLRNLCMVLLGAIISQGVLGGVRVLLDARTAAMIHGCMGPLVFALGAFIVFASSADWKKPAIRPISRRFNRVCVSLVILCVVQLFVGAHLRHSQPAWLPSFFVSIVHTHLTFAALIALVIFGIFVSVWSGKSQNNRRLRGPASALLLIVVSQVLLGFSTWIAKYATPWMELTPWLARYTLQGKGFWESMIVTGHQATGSLLIVFSLWLTCRAYRRTDMATTKELIEEEVPSRSSFRVEPVALSLGAE